MNALLTVSVVAIALFAWASVVRIVPFCAVSLFRYRLWRIRDQLVDEVRHGKFDDIEQPKILVSLVEATIAGAKDLTALNMLLLRLAAPRDVSPPHPLNLDDLNPSDRELVEGHLHRLLREMAIHTLGGTPSGWICSIVLLPLAVVVTVVTRLRGKGDGGSVIQATKLHVLEEVDPAALALMSRRNDRRGRSLYQHV
jgi:hypothetical protein